MPSMCMHCLEEGDWPDEDKCPKCEAAGHTSPWSVSGCAACNKEFFDKMAELKAKVGIRDQVATDRDLLIKALEIMIDSEWATHNAAENQYCPSCAKSEDRWRDQYEHYPDCKWVDVVSRMKKLLGV